MGVFDQFKNKQKTKRQRKSMKLHRVRNAEGKKKEQAELNLEDVQLFSKDVLKKKMKNMRNNVTISNKKRNRLLKRLRHSQREKETIQADTDVQMTETTPKATKGSGKVKGKKARKVKATTSSSADVNDVMMEDTGE